MNLRSGKLLTGAPSAGSTRPVDSAALDFAGLEARLESLRDKWNVPGMVAGIARGNQIVWTKAFGYANLTTRAPVTPDTVFHLASLTFLEALTGTVWEGGSPSRRPVTDRFVAVFSKSASGIRAASPPGFD